MTVFYLQFGEVLKELAMRKLLKKKNLQKNESFCAFQQAWTIPAAKKV